MSTQFIHPIDEINLGLSRITERALQKDPKTSYLKDSRQSVDETMKKIQEIKGAMHPLALQFSNTEMTYKPIQPGAIVEVTEPIKNVLLELNNRYFNYVVEMQEYIEFMKLGVDDLTQFVEFVTHICDLVSRYKHKGQLLMTKDALLEELGPEKFGSPQRRKVLAGRQSSILINLLDKIKKHVNDYDNASGSHDTLLIVCRHLREQVVPMLQVLKDMNKSPEGHAFIQQLKLNELILQLKEIDKLEKSLKGAELRVRIDAEARKEMIGDFGTKFANKNVYSANEEAFLASGNASQSVIGNSTFSSKGGRRTRHKRSGHKRINKKRRSNKKKCMSRRR